MWNCLINLEGNPKCSRLFQLPGPLSPSARIIFNQDKKFKLIVRSQKLEKSSLKCIRPLGTKPRDSTQELSLLLRLKKKHCYIDRKHRSVVTLIRKPPLVPKAAKTRGGFLIKSSKIPPKIGTFGGRRRF